MDRLFTNKKVQLFGALLSETILFPVPHHHFTFGIPKMLRPYLRYERDLLPTVGPIVTLRIAATNFLLLAD